MKRMLAATVASVFTLLSLAAPLSASAGNQAEYENTYRRYLQNADQVQNGAGEAAVSFENAVLSGGAAFGEYGGKTQTVLMTQAQAQIQLPVEVLNAGLFELTLLYTGMTESDKAIRFALEIDGEQPFFEAGTLELPRCYVNEPSDFATDSLGNQLRPAQAQAVYWQTSPLYREDIGTQAPYSFYLTQGAHTVTLTVGNGGVCLAGVSLKSASPLMDYRAYTAAHGKQNAAGAEAILLEGEKADRKSDRSLYPLTDRTNCATQPFSESHTVLNTIGGSNWSAPGQWIEWEFDVEQAGLYQISMRVRQNANQGMKCYRTVSINGEVPFSELSSYGFSYNRSWYLETLSDPATGDPFAFYLEPGRHVLRLEATSGEMSGPLEEADTLLTELNDLYHNIIMITGTSPDAYRDYNLESAIPGLVDAMNRLADGLDGCMQDIQKITGDSATQAVSLTTLSDQLRALAQRPKTISDRISNFYSNISAVSAWANSAFQQPLEIDYIRVSPSGSALPKADAGFFKKLASGVKAFVYSFLTDYDSIGGADGEADIVVWTAAGRAQAEALKQLIDRDFTSQYGVNVSLKLVQTGLVEAVVAGTGPDLALSIPYNQPVDFASRGILTPLSGYSDYDELIHTNFHESAVIPYGYRDQVYALPETQEFNMMFYRTDVLSQLGLTVPDTWNELTDMMAVLARNNMQIGVTSLTSTSAGVINTAFPKMLITMFLQNGVDLYTSDLRSTNLGSAEAVKAFEQLTDLYAKYGLPVYFDGNNRFRTGEMPLMIAPMSTYNNLSISAPEIAGRWEMAQIPGILNTDGSINRADEFTGTCCVMFESTKNKEAGWKFLKWWVSEQTQYDYGMELEAILGVSGRYLTANKLAFDRLPWNADTAKVIERQWQEVTTVPQAPGYYFVSRYLTNAISDTIINNENPRVVLNRYCDTINAELKRKNEQLDALWPDTERRE